MLVSLNNETSAILLPEINPEGELNSFEMQKLSFVTLNKYAWALVTRLHRLYLTLEFCIYLDLSSVSVGIKTCSCWMLRLRSIQNTNNQRLWFTFTSPRRIWSFHVAVLQRTTNWNVRRFITHVHCHCFAHETFSLMTSPLPEQTKSILYSYINFTP